MERWGDTQRAQRMDPKRRQEPRNRVDQRKNQKASVLFTRLYRTGGIVDLLQGSGSLMNTDRRWMEMIGSALRWLMTSPAPRSYGQLRVSLIIVIIIIIIIIQEEGDESPLALFQSLSHHHHHTCPLAGRAGFCYI